jgi:hypothetical protein
MESVADFARRTEGPAVPYVPDWYPWVYAHHYLRLEAASLPAGLRRAATSLSLSDVRELIYLWCGLSGESVQPAVQSLADAYLRRWGIVRDTARERPVVPATVVPATVAPGRRWRRQQWPAGRIPDQRGRTRRVAAVAAPRSA